MELNEINSANMTDRIVESISRTNDGSVHEENSALNEHIQREDREESEEIYEEYKFEGDYEEYRFRCQECNQEIEETEELYEEYIYEGDYEEYRFRCQKCGQERKTVNTSNDRTIDETFFQRILKRKWWLICMILVLVIVGTVVGLSIHFIEPIMTEPVMTEPITTDPIRTESTTTKELGLKEAVLILSTKESSNVPMVLTLTGESKQVSA